MVTQAMIFSVSCEIPFLSNKTASFAYDTRCDGCFQLKFSINLKIIIAFSGLVVYNISRCKYPGVAQLVGRLVWELEHCICCSLQNVVYSSVYPQNLVFSPVECSKNLW